MQVDPAAGQKKHEPGEQPADRGKHRPWQVGRHAGPGAAEDTAPHAAGADQHDRELGAFGHQFVNHPG